MRLIFGILFIIVTSSIKAQNNPDYWNWIEIMNTRNQDDAATYFKFCSTGEFIQDPKYGSPGFYLTTHNLGIIIGKEENSHLLGEAPGNTISLFVTRDNVSMVYKMISQLVSNYFSDGDSYITLLEGGVKVSSGRYDSDRSKEGLQVDLDELLNSIDMSNENSEVRLMLFNANNALNRAAVRLKISQEEYYGYNWLFQVSGTELHIDELLASMPLNIDYLQCRLDNSHAYLSLAIGTTSKFKIEGLFDTGASMLTIPENVANELLKSNDARLIGTQKFSTANGIITSDIILIDAIFAQGKMFRNIKAAVGVTEDVLIGQSLLKDSDWGYDNASGRILFK